ncbi:MAG: hypothetical protein NDI81_10955 [Desulfobacula sp.]|nr:hypothetical protein [Desulfobacula sp.]
MNANNNFDLEKKEKWVTPELTVISGLDSCVEFLYGSGGNPIGGDGPPPPNFP